jgi:hypothetical protein
VDLRSHVALSTKLGAAESGAVSACNWGGEAEIGNLKVEVGVIENVLWFEISVGNAALVHVVKAIDKLLKVETGEVLLITAGQGDVVEKFTTSCKLEGNANNGVLGSVLLFDMRILAVLDQIDDVGVRQSAHSLHLGHDELEEFSVEIGIALLHDLNGVVALSILVLSELDL